MLKCIFCCPTDEREIRKRLAAIKRNGKVGGTVLCQIINGFLRNFLRHLCCTEVPISFIILVIDTVLTPEIASLSNLQNKLLEI